jgi:hypothetical protein
MKHLKIKNVNIFDGKSEKLAVGQTVLVEGSLTKMEPAMTSP